MKALLTCALLALTAAAPPEGTPSEKFLLPSPLEDHIFENRNLEVTDDDEVLFEGDIVLTPEQWDSRSVEPRLWTSPVSFAISSSSAGDRDAILAAIQHFRDHTCIEFTEVAEGSAVAHLNFVKEGGRCTSSLGQRVDSGPQNINIGNRCEGLKETSHEIGHAMGRFHQHNRADRDGYVTILSENVDDRYKPFFEKNTNYNYSVPYDLTSMMHYGTFTFTKGGVTIRANNFMYQDILGKTHGMSHRDKQMINAMYKCASNCSNPPTCQNGGFVDKTCTCVCPPNTSGANCETLNGNYYGVPACGDANVTREGTITSPNYPDKYPKNVICWWVIDAPAGQRVKVTVTDMKILGRYTDGRCLWDQLALRYSGDVYTDDLQACGTELQGQSFTSTGSQFIVQFWSGSYGWYRGFSADVKFVA